MPRHRINIVYGVSPVPTPNGIHMMNQAYGGELDNEEHLAQVLEAWNKPQAERGMVTLTATKQELKNLDGTLSAKSLLDLSQAKFIQLFEETDLDISTSSVVRNIKS